MQEAQWIAHAIAWIADNIDISMTSGLIDALIVCIGIALVINIVN